MNNIQFYLHKVAIRWLLQKENVPSIVLGVNKLAQLQDNLGSLGWAIDTEEMAKLDEVKRQRGRGQGFCDDRNKALVLKGVTVGEGNQKLQIIRICVTSIMDDS